MRKLGIVICAVLTALSARAAVAENAFVDGTVWEMISSYEDPNMEAVYYQCKLDGVREIGGYEAMQMYVLSQKSDPQLEAFVRTEGDKVYFTIDEENPEWYLLYDFGMKPGDEQICYNISTGRPSDGMLIRCLAETTDPMYGDYPALEMVKVIDGEEYRHTEIWLIGVGSRRGPGMSCLGDLVSGGGTDIQRVTNGDRVICEMTESGIATPIVEQTSGADSYYNLQGVRISNPSNGVFIRVEGGKTSKVLIK